MTQLEKAKKGVTTKEMKKVAKAEGIPAEFVRKKVANGEIVIPANTIHLKKGLKAIGIGSALKTKINTNIGTSPLREDEKCEVEKLKIAVKYGTDAAMDLSTGRGIDSTRRKIIRSAGIPIGTVPIYQVLAEKPLSKISEEDIFSVIERQCRDGVDFITVHAGITRKNAPLAKDRLTGIVSRGGSMIAKWIEYSKKENPLYEDFDLLCDIARKYDVTLSLGDALRPGSIKDSTDHAQLCELKILGKLAARANALGVQAMIEGPGHIPLHEIRRNVELEKKYCNNAPFYVLGPIVTDIAPGYDHITGAIGASIAAMHGAAFLCYVTPSEHLGLPSVEDVREGVIAFKIAAHAADISKGIKGAEKWDNEMSRHRKKLDWKKMIELAINPEKALDYRKRLNRSIAKGTCSMCGEFCPMKERVGKNAD